MTKQKVKKKSSWEDYATTAIFIIVVLAVIGTILYIVYDFGTLQANKQLYQDGKEVGYIYGKWEASQVCLAIMSMNDTELFKLAGFVMPIGFGKNKTTIAQQEINNYHIINISSSPLKDIISCGTDAWTSNATYCEICNVYGCQVIR